MENRFLSRGQRIDNGEWVVGYHRYFDTCHFMYPCGKPLTEYCTIDPKTLSQCTGLKDKNGKLIFEGDYIKWWDKWENGYSAGLVKWHGEERYPAFDISISECDCNGLSYLFANASQIEVAGNRWDNPNLLEKI